MKQILLILAVVALLGLGYWLLTSNDSLTEPVEPITYTSDVVTFSTDDSQFTVQYSEDSQYAQLNVDGTQYDLMRAVSASGAKYANEEQTVVFWEHQGQAMLEINGQTVVDAATTAESNGDDNVLTFNIDSEKVECVGVGPQECLVVNGEYFYDTIQGFTFEPGFEYVLLVERTKRENVPADASKYTYTLVEEVSKNPVASEFELEGTAWLWEETLYANDDIVIPEQADAFVLTFTEEGRFSATTDCNALMGSYVSPDEEGINFSPIAATKKACLDGSQETEFTKMLEQVNDYVLTQEGNLALTLELDTGTMLFVPIE